MKIGVLSAQFIAFVTAVDFSFYPLAARPDEDGAHILIDVIQTYSHTDRRIHVYRQPY